MRVDLSVIVTAHDETLVCGPSLRAADLAIQEAEEAGFLVERIIALDKATEATTAYFHQPAFDHWERRVMSCGDLGRVRNALIPEVAGDAIAFLDADDLFSPNWLAQAMTRLRAAEARGERVIVHPELNWLFDGAHSVYWKPDQDDPLFLPQYFYFMNYYDSLCLCPRAAHLAVPYVSRDIPRGLSFQDWQFSIESMAAGWKHVSAPDTLIFKRRRDASLVTESRARRALVRPLAPMRADRVQALARRPALRDANSTVASLSPTALSGASERAAVSFAEHSSPFDTTEPSQTLPHYGAGLSARVEEAKAALAVDKRAQEAATTEAYQRIAPHFDYAFYLTQHPDIARAKRIDPVAHYIRAGAREGRDPTPWFSSKAYLQRYPEVVDSGENPFDHYLRTGDAEGYVSPPMPGFDRLAKTIGRPAKEVEQLYQARFRDLRQRLETGELGRQVTLTEAIEPLVALGWAEALNVKIPPFHTPLVANRLAAFLDILDDVGPNLPRFMICVNRPRFGGALRLEGQIAQALAMGCAAEDILVVITDDTGLLPAHRVPQGARQVNFADHVTGLRPPQRERVLAELIRALAPEYVFNVNARLLWDTMTTYGDALVAGTKIIAALFCGEQTQYGHWTGYPLRRTYRHFNQLHAVITDSAALRDDLIDRHMIPEAEAQKIVTLHAPVDPRIARVEPRGQSHPRPRVFWAGRFDRQKRFDLVMQIAAELPDIDFHLWGEEVMDTTLPSELPANIHLRGTYARFAELDLSTADLWLYTSAWDGVPQMLLEVAMTGLPIVASDVGGTREAALPDMATLLGSDAPLEVWRAAIQGVLSDLPTAQDRAQTLRTTLIRERTWARYGEDLWACLEADRGAPDRDVQETERPGPKPLEPSADAV